jgi:predicted aldo/keto reductase-like oxidoreductase
MKYRKFGKTGLTMPVLSCGLMRSMFSWQDIRGSKIPHLRRQQFAEVVEAALQHGITHLETARGYGSSERQLGWVLADYDRDSFILQTKVSPEDEPDRFTANVEDSLARLGQKRLDLLALHGINDYRSLWQVCRPGGCLAAARRLQAQGKVDWIGFSGHGDLEILLSAIRHEGDRGFDYINLHWYTIYQRNSPALAAAEERNMGVFIISPTDKGGMLQKAPEKLCTLSSPLTAMQFNDLFCLQRSEIDTISVGAACPGDFKAHLEILSRIDDYALVKDIYRRWGQAMEEESGSCRPDALWNSFPSWRQTPGYMNIGFMLWLYNLVRGWGLLEFSRNRYQMLGLEMPWVAGNNAGSVQGCNLEKIAGQADMSAEELTALLTDIHTLLGRKDPS